MKTFFMIMFITISSLSNGQINNSAKELAKENTNKYLSNAVFKNRSYKQTSFGELKPFDLRSSDIEWVMDQKVEAEQTRKLSDTSSKTITQEYSFRFYLDHKMEVLKTECYYIVARD
ncbi:MAG: hypothetical protein ACJ749_17805 [Flavisolibacter sp.]